MKKNLIFKFFAAVAIVASLASCGRNGKKQAAEAAEQAALDSIAAAQQIQKEKDIMEKLAQLPEEPMFDMVTNMGTIRIKLYSGTPKHRENFAKLALEGYYDGMLFHRVINGFMIQGGDPLSKDPDMVASYGTGGPGYTVPAEFVKEYTHKKGALAAARRGDAANPEKASSGSQFYLVQDAGACAALDGDYTVFGETISGIDVIDKIAAVKTGARDLPVNPVQIVSVKLVTE